MIQTVSRGLAWAAKNERHLGAVAFIFGFAVDLFTFTVLSVAYANLAFAGYLSVAAISIFVSTAFPRSEAYASAWKRVVSVIAPLAAQYGIGSLLSGFMIFYTKSSTLTVAWPFLVFIALIFIGNEYFRTYYKYVAFQLALLYFAWYAYLIFAVPLAVQKLGADIFLLSTVISVFGFTLYIWLLSRVNAKQIKRSFRYALPGALVTLLLVNAAYFTGILPPIPLTMSEAGMYHGLSKQGTRYVLMAEQPMPWYQFYTPVTVHMTPQEVLYAYASIAAPIKFSAGVVHRWEHRDAVTQKWVTESSPSFPISGGRPGGYRGYSEFTPRVMGDWRVSVETPNGQVIGRIPFTLVLVDTPPVLHEETH